MDQVLHKRINILLNSIKSGLLSLDFSLSYRSTIHYEERKRRNIEK